MEKTQPGPGWDTAAAQKQIHLFITCFKPSRPQHSVKLLALEIVNFLFVPFPPLRFYQPKPSCQLPAFLHAQIMEIRQRLQFTGLR